MQCRTVTVSLRLLRLQRDGHGFTEAFTSHHNIVQTYHSAETDFKDRHGVLRWMPQMMRLRMVKHGADEMRSSAIKSIVLAPMHFRLKCRAGLSKSTLH